MPASVGQVPDCAPRGTSCSRLEQLSRLERLFLFWACSLLRALLSHHAKVVLGVLVAVLGLNDVTASRRILRHRGVALVVVAGVLRRVTPFARSADSRWPLLYRPMAVRSLATIVPLFARSTVVCMVAGPGISDVRFERNCCLRGPWSKAISDVEC